MQKSAVNSNAQSTKTHSFMRPLDHIRRRKIVTCLELSHKDKPTYFQVEEDDNYSRYRSEFKQPVGGYCGRQMNLMALRPKPNPLQACRLTSFAPGTTVPKNTPRRFQPKQNTTSALPTMDLRTWNSLVHRSFDPEEIRLIRRENKVVKKAATGIVPATRGDNEEEDDENIVDPWLPATLALSTAIAVNKPYQYLPRRRKIIKPSLSSAGIRGAKVPDEDRFFHPIKARRGNQPKRITVRCD